MTDIVLEITRAALVGVIFVFLLFAGKREELRRQKGWMFILTGFAFLFLGMLIDITDNFPALNRYVIIGDTVYQAFLEKLVGYLFGFLLLAIGFIKWIPTVIELNRTEKSLKAFHSYLEEKVKERTQELVTLNRALEEEVAERKKAQESIRETEKRFRTLVEQSPISIQILDPQGVTIQVNSAWEKLWGLSLESLKGYNILEDRQLEELGIISYLRRAYAGEAVFIPAVEYDAQKTLGEGESCWVQAHVYPVKRDNGELRMVVLMHEDITKRKLTEKRLEESLKEKEVLMKEIHHRVKNNMAVITSLLSLQSARIENEDYRKIFSNSINRIKSMALIHEKLYRSDDISRIYFNEYITDMMGNMAKSYGMSNEKVTLVNDVDNVSLGVDNAIPCGLIINELVSNAFEHAFPDGRAGEVRVSLKQDSEGMIRLVVDDNGIGFPEGFDSVESDSLGLNLVRALVGQIQGELDLSADEGTRYEIRFRDTEAAG